jgi:site-specific recombinase XerC
MLSLLRQKGIVKQCPPAVADSARSKIASEFHRYLLQEIGRSLSTAKNYVPFIDQFLIERFQNRTPVLASLRASNVTGFVIRHAHQLSPVRAGIMVTALRSFFRYLLHRGAITTDLAGCVPAVPNWSLSSLPRFLPAGAVEKLLKRCDRKTRLAGGTRRSCCCSPGSACVPAKSSS